MAPISDRIQYLLQQYIGRTASQAEVTELFAWIRETGDDELIRQQLWAYWNRQPADEEIPAPDFDHIYASIRAAMPAVEPAPAKIWKLWPRIAIAASILLLLVTGAFFLFHPADRPAIAGGAERSKNDIPPGDNKAILTLSNGQRILLDSAHSGQLASQGSARIIKLDSGQLAYSAPETTNNHVLAYNTLTTPRGGQYQLTLSDGTKVWLNAASSITFPTAFAGGERKVEISGEAYFEVVKNTAMPFVVKVNTIDVKVLGTHFDVMAYADEAAWKATLLEGSVSVGETGNNERARTMLKAGNQALIDPASAAIKVIADADLELAVAWKNGYTAFKSADIRSIMRQVERWYDMNVHYEGDIPRRAFTGKISRGANLSEVFNILEESKIHFKVEGKNIIVTP